MYEHETLWVESINDAEYFEGHLKDTRGHPRSNEVKWGKHWCMDMKLGTVVGNGHTRFAAHVARPSGGQRSSRGQIRSNRVNVGL